MTATLPDADWRHAPDLKRIVAALHDDIGGPLVVGGAVRDSLLGQDVTDIDLATPLHPEQVMARLDAIGIKVIPTGVDHGTVTAVGDGENYEITTLRRDVATDGRRATVAFADNWREDAERRDFTINALYAHIESGEILDYFEGLGDLASGTVRFIGDAATRIAEDYLRIMRYFRFFARFGRGNPDPQALEACSAAAHSLTALSRERIAQELLKIVALPDPSATIALMQTHGIFAQFMPEIVPDAAEQMAQLVIREKAKGLSPSLPARFLSLLPRDAIVVDKVAARLKLSNKFRENLAARIAVQAENAGDIRAAAYRKDIEAARDAALLYASDANVDAMLSALHDWEVPAFTIKGGDLIARGLTAGPVVAKTLQAVEARWIEEGFPAAERLNEIADQAAVSALLASRKE